MIYNYQKPCIEAPNEEQLGKRERSYGGKKKKNMKAIPSVGGSTASAPGKNS